MFGYVMPKIPHCPNCKGVWDEVECMDCGFKNIKANELPPVALVFCAYCGCNYTDFCPTHPITQSNPSDPK